MQKGGKQPKLTDEERRRYASEKQGIKKLGVLSKPLKSIKTGEYTVYLEPSALNEICILVFINKNVFKIFRIYLFDI